MIDFSFLCDEALGDRVSKMDFDTLGSMFNSS